MLRLRRPSRSTLLMFAGLGVGIGGLVVQFFADRSKFSDSFPPGIAFIVVFGLLSLFTARWWWHPAFGAFIAFWIVGVGGVAGQLTPNLTSHNAGTVTGNVVMSLGLVLAFAAGVAGMVTGRRAHRAAAPREREPVHQG